MRTQGLLHWSYALLADGLCDDGQCRYWDPVRGRTWSGPRSLRNARVLGTGEASTIHDTMTNARMADSRHAQQSREQWDVAAHKRSSQLAAALH